MDSVDTETIPNKRYFGLGWPRIIAMRIAAKSTLSLLLLYVILLVGLGFWMERGLRDTARDLMEDTARLVGQQISLALRENILQALDQWDQQAQDSLEKSVTGFAERSDIITSIDVIDSEGWVIASDDESLLGQTMQSPDALFQENRDIQVFSTFENRFGPGMHRVAIPLLEEGNLRSYLEATLSNQPIVEIYDQAYGLLAMIALGGLVAIVGLGLLLQFQLNRLGRGLANLVDSVEQNPALAQSALSDEFAPVRQAAGRLGMVLHEARGKADLALRDLDMLARAVRIGVLLLNADNKPKFISDAAKELLTGDQPEHLDQRLRTIRDRLNPLIERMRHDGRMLDTADLSLEYEGGTRNLRFELHAVEGHEWRGCLMLIKDRGMLDALEIDLREASRFRGLSRLYKGAVHDLRAPLNAMVMNLEMLGSTLREASPDDPALRERQTRYMDVISQELQRLNRSVNSLLEQTLPADEQRTAVALKELCAGLETLLAPQARQQGVGLDFRFPEQPIMVTGIPGQLRQALLNILLNAFEAMPRGGRVEVRLDGDDEQARLSICDTGPGIPSALRGKVFDMHFTTRDTGTGIGLYIARSMIERHGGTIRLETELGSGSCFTITLPRKKTANLAAVS